MKITLKQLRRLGACINQVELFKATFGAKVEITEAVCKEYGGKFDTNWLAWKLFSPELYAEYRAKCAQLLNEYRAKCAPLDAEYRAKYAPVFLKCLEKMEGK